MRRALLGCALSACSGVHRAARPVMPACTVAVQPGLITRALTWNGDGWGAALAEGSELFLREFGVDGRARGERVSLVDETSSAARVSLAWSEGAYYVTVGPHREGASTRVFRATSRGAEANAFAIDDAVTGDLAVIARPGVSSRPAALFVDDGRGVALRLIARDGEPGAPRRCPSEVHPRAVLAWRDGFRAVTTRSDASTGEVHAVEVVGLDDECEPKWRTRVWDGDVNGRAHALSVDEEGVVAAFSARDGGTWIAGVDHDGHVRIRAARMERQAHEPQVFSQTNATGRRIGLQVVAARSIETGDRLETWRLGPDALLREVREITASPAVVLRGSVADPWGGGLVVFTREETTHGSARTGAGAYGFFARVCP